MKISQINTFLSFFSSHKGLMTVQLEQSTPIIFGVLMCLNENQARIRAGLDSGEGQASRNHGEEWGETAVEMALLRKNLS